MSITKLLLIFLVAILFHTKIARGMIVKNYQAIFAIVSEKEDANFLFAIRSFRNQLNDEYLLVVNPYTFKTKISVSNNFHYYTKIQRGLDYTIYDEKLISTPYIKALYHYTATPYVLQNQGLKHGENFCKKEAFLTIDLCPSKQDFDKDFFERIIISQDSQVPIAISVSGLWLIHHKNSFSWIKENIKNGNIDVTWVNHTYSHPYFHNIPIEQNFLLTLNTNLDKEFLDLEALLISNDETPSIFARLPGLVSDQNVIICLRKLGLIPLGADAWLAKGEKMRDGSIVLVHGNGNEPEGIRKLSLGELSQWKWLAIVNALTSND